MVKMDNLWDPPSIDDRARNASLPGESMADRIVASAWWIVVTSFIVASACGCVLATYCGIVELTAGRWSAAGQSIGAGSAAAVVCGLFVRNRNDLLV